MIWSEHSQNTREWIQRWLWLLLRVKIQHLCQLWLCPCWLCVCVRVHAQLSLSFCKSSQCIFPWVVPEAHIQWSGVNIWGTHLLIHFSWQQHAEWAEDLFPPSAEPSLSTESNSAPSQLGSFFVLLFCCWGIFLPSGYFHASFCSLSFQDALLFSHVVSPSCNTCVVLGF